MMRPKPRSGAKCRCRGVIAPIGYLRSVPARPTSTSDFEIAHGSRGAMVDARRGEGFVPVDRKSGKRALESVGDARCAERTDRWAATGSPNWTIDSVIVGGRWVSSDARLAVRTWPRLSAPSSPLGSRPISLSYRASSRCPSARFPSPHFVPALISTKPRQGLRRRPQVFRLAFTLCDWVRSNQ